MTGITYDGPGGPCWRAYQLSWSCTRTVDAQGEVDRAYYPPEGSGIPRMITRVPMPDFYNPRKPGAIPWYDE